MPILVDQESIDAMSEYCIGDGHTSERTDLEYFEVSVVSIGWLAAELCLAVFDAEIEGESQGVAG